MSRISIVLPLYNADLRCLIDCVQSISKQTLNDFECIFVNDGSPTRECVEWAQGYAEKDHRFRLIEKENGGVSTARNFGVRAATSKYVTFIDQDDLLHPQRFEAAISLLDETGADVCECTVSRPAFEFSYEVAKFDEYELNNVRANSVLLRGHDILTWYLNQKMNITVWSHVYKRDLLLKYPLPEHIWGCDDIAYSLESCNRISSLVRIAEVLYFWRKNPKATTGRVPFAYVNGVKQAVMEVVNYYRDVDLSSENWNSLHTYLAGAFISVLRDTLLVERIPEEREKIIVVTRETDCAIDGGLVVRSNQEDALWLKFMIDGDFLRSTKGARSVARRLRRAKRWVLFKRNIKKLLSRVR